MNSTIWRAFWVMWALVGILLLVTGCGGSYVDDESDERPAVCQQNPKACI